MATPLAGQWSNEQIRVAYHKRWFGKLEVIEGLVISEPVLIVTTDLDDLRHLDKKVDPHRIGFIRAWPPPGLRAARGWARPLCPAQFL